MRTITKVRTAIHQVGSRSRELQRLMMLPWSEQTHRDVVLTRQLVEEDIEEAMRRVQKLVEEAVAAREAKA